jgi:hypothetical protein
VPYYDIPAEVEPIALFSGLHSTDKANPIFVTLQIHDVKNGMILRDEGERDGKDKGGNHTSGRNLFCSIGVDSPYLCLK